jgi:uncharacterized protein
MLLNFTVGNYKSFKEKATLSMEADNDDWLDEENVFVAGDLRLLKTAALFGANASGKSNFLKAMDRFRAWVPLSSNITQERIPVVPFRLDADTEKAPTFFEVEFLQNETRYRYGFETTSDAVSSEWLFSRRNSSRETRLFTRESDLIEPSESFKEGKGKEKLTRPNSLFLSVCALLNGEVSQEIMAWISRFRGISGLDDFDYLPFTIKCLNDVEYAGPIRELIRKADIGIESIRAEEPENAGSSGIKTSHRKFGPDQKAIREVEFDLDLDESGGTKKFIGLSGPVLHTLKEGSILFVDELEAQLHPLLTKALVGLFNSSANANHAQLIFATHDQGLLDPKQMRRDQAWFVEKDGAGASRLYNLAEFKGVRKEAKFSREYLLGQFGAIPHINNFDETLTHGRE